MLTGRESLVRVIGKPRRFLPNRRSILFAAHTSASASTDAVSQSRLSPHKEDKEDGKFGSVEEGSEGGELAELVNCPVCGARLPSLDNTLINSHLDDCLSRGSKRKFSQVTLLQLNFSKSKVKLLSSDVPDKENHVFLCEPKRISTCDAIHISSELDCFEENDNKHYSISCRNYTSTNFAEHLVETDLYGDKFASPPSLMDINTTKHVPEECLDERYIFKESISTSIVGRRYGNIDVLDPQSKICLCRDSDNVKDPNAIKVLYVDSEYDNILGYIPRELAQCLSPLMDKFHFNFEGIITAVPKDSRAAVPIQITLKNFELLDQIHMDIEDFKSLWRNTLRVVDLAKPNLLGMAKHMHNLVLLIQEVLKSNPHLFTQREISFLELLDSLPDNSKRLFARLYARKGPWFRMSNISYPEISDCHLAVKKLIEAGYIYSFQRNSELEDYCLKELLKILNVDELRGALRVLNKKCSHGTRKQEIIDLLLSLSKDGLW